MDGSFECIGVARVDEAPSPVVLSVPHAGRDYPTVLLAALRVPAAALVVLEDRHVDRLAIDARDRQAMLVQRRARAWIDLNRGEDERDPLIDDGARPQAQPMRSAKLRSGLGLVPRRAGAAGDLWRRRFADGEILGRILHDHRPYHAALAALLAAARARFGVAVLIDVHSMPPVGAHAQIVLGDRFGRAAHTRFVARMEAAAAAHGIRSARNTPYAGGHILERHADPAAGVHAIQVEVDRTLYLDHTLANPGPGMARITSVLRDMIRAAEDEALAASPPAPALAAE